jgi:hypothetical protein
MAPAGKLQFLMSLLGGKTFGDLEIHCLLLMPLVRVQLLSYHIVGHHCQTDCVPQCGTAFWLTRIAQSEPTVFGKRYETRSPEKKKNFYLANES